MLNFNSRNMIMKKLYTVVTVFLFAILAGCSDFLEQDNKSNVPGADYYNTSAGFESLCNAAYGSLRTIYSDAPWLFEEGLIFLQVDVLLCKFVTCMVRTIQVPKKM